MHALISWPPENYPMMITIMDLFDKDLIIERTSKDVMAREFM